MQGLFCDSLDSKRSFAEDVYKGNYGFKIHANCPILKY